MTPRLSAPTGERPDPFRVRGAAAEIAEQMRASGATYLRATTIIGHPVFEIARPGGRWRCLRLRNNPPHTCAAYTIRAARRRFNQFSEGGLHT